MHRRLFPASFAALIWVLLLAAPVAAHGDHDARPLARDLPAGPHRISLWQVYSDASMSMTPHVIVLFDGVATAPTGVSVAVAVNALPRMVHPSNTTANGFETMDGVTEGDVITVSISSGTQTWDVAPVTVTPPPTSMLPMSELLYAAIALTAVTAVWMARRTARVWRRPIPSGPANPSEPAMQGGEPSWQR